MRRTTIGLRTGVASMLVAGTVSIAGLSLTTASATVEPGTPAKDVHVGLDDDNADNAFIQPAGSLDGHAHEQHRCAFRTGQRRPAHRQARRRHPARRPRQRHPGRRPRARAHVRQRRADRGRRERREHLVARRRKRRSRRQRRTRHVARRADQREGRRFPDTRSSHHRQVPRVRIDDDPSLSCTIAAFPSARRRVSSTSYVSLWTACLQPPCARRRSSV